MEAALVEDVVAVESSSSVVGFGVAGAGVLPEEVFDDFFFGEAVAAFFGVAFGVVLLFFFLGVLDEELLLPDFLLFGSAPGAGNNIAPAKISARSAAKRAWGRETGVKVFI